MSFIQCSVCEATVDATKAYCPECGSAMDEEEKRTSFSEFDQLMKTQNINSTTHFRLMEQFKLSSVFKPPQGAEADQNLEKNKEVADAKAAVAKTPPEKTPDPKLAVVNTASAARGKVGGQIENKPEDDKTSTSNTKMYIIIGAATFFLALFVVSIVLGLLYWFYPR